MGIFNNNLQIDTENPFKNDKLNREAEIKNLTSAFQIVENQMVLAVDSKWGTGKTSFLNMWNQYLLNEGYKTIFINAWENDYIEEPFITFIEEIRKSINDENKAKGLIDKAKDVGLALAQQSPKIIFKAIKDKTGFDAEDLISEDELTQMISDKINIYNKNKNSMQKFRNELEKLAGEQFKENNKPIVIFIDELDRCRPNYAISLLERVKHFFNVQNIVFILGIDKEALSNSIKVIYGDLTDINGYLTRFIDIDYKLNNINKALYIDYLLEKYNFKDIFDKRRGKVPYSEEYDYEEFENIIKEYFLKFDLSLRDIEKITINILMIIKARTNNFIYTYPLLFLCVLKKLDDNLYSKIKSGDFKFSELISEIPKNQNVVNWFEETHTRGYVAKAFILWLINDKDEIELLKAKVPADNNKQFFDSASLCLDSFKSITNRMSYLHGTARKIIFEEVELYENFGIVGE